MRPPKIKSRGDKMQRRTYIAVTLVERWLMKWQPSGNGSRARPIPKKWEVRRTVN